MNFNLFKIVVFLFILSVLITSPPLISTPSDRFSCYEKFSSIYIYDTFKKYGFYIQGEGSNGLSDIVLRNFYIKSRNEMSTEEGRKIALVLIARALEAYNSKYRQLRPFLHDFPIDVRNLRIILEIKDVGNEKYCSKGTDTIHIVDNVLVFRDYFKKSEWEESFQEAAEKVRQYEIANGLEDSSACYQSIMHLKPLPKRKGGILKTPRLPPVATPR